MICCKYALHSPSAWSKEFEVSPSGRANSNLGTAAASGPCAATAWK
jgi:hypothetical protein